MTDQDLPPGKPTEWRDFFTTVPGWLTLITAGLILWWVGSIFIEKGWELLFAIGAFIVVIFLSGLFHGIVHAAIARRFPLIGALFYPAIVTLFTASYTNELMLPITGYGEFLVVAIINAAPIYWLIAAFIHFERPPNA